MSLSLYEASIPGFIRSLKNLASFLDKAEAHAKSTGASLQTYLDARLADDMHPLSRQIQMCSDSSKGPAARLSDQAPPSMPDTETTWEELRERIAKTLVFLQAIRPEQVDGREETTIEMPLPGGKLTFTAKDFLFQFAIPNHLFHITTAYALLRAQGVPLGKMDFLAGGSPVSQAA